MKKVFIILLLIAIKGKSQPKETNTRVGFIAEIPFFIESSLYKNYTIEYLEDNTMFFRMEILAPEIKIGFFSDKKDYSRIYRLDFKKKEKGALSPPIVQFKIEGTNFKSEQWRQFKLNDSAYLNKYIVDTYLKSGQEFLVKFRKPEGKVFQTIAFKRITLTPSILLYKEIKFLDTTAKAFRDFILQEKKGSGAFKEVTGNLIQTDPTHSLELVFSNQLVNKDSSISYRLNPQSGDTAWVKTGHFALVRGLKANRTYLLEVKYDGIAISNKYSITILPFWYQTTLAIIVFIGIIFFSLFILWIIRHKIKLKAEKKKMELTQYKLKAVQSQLNPHFIFNALSSIQSLMNIDEKKMANRYLSNFSNVLRGALKNSESAFVSFEKELGLMKDYLEIEQLRFQFEYNFIIDAALNPSEIEVPPMLFQPSIENAIKHGGGKKGKAGLIEVQVCRSQRGFYLSVFDNGEWEKETEVTGMGISLIKERIAAINSISKDRKIEYKTVLGKNKSIIYFHFHNWLI